jgi:uncharacterized protein (TIGR02118 family)
MVKLSVLYGRPSDLEAFERHYTATHVPLVEQIPYLERFEAGRVIGTPDGSEAPYYRIAELWFDGQAALADALSSPEGRATVDDISNFASGGAVAMICEVD